MERSICTWFICAMLALSGCTDGGQQKNHPDPGGDTGGDSATGADTGDADTDASPLEPQVVHVFDGLTLEPGSETEPCVQWSLHNEKPLYVNAVTMANDGGFHHSNWYVVPEDHVAGEDGMFECEERGWSELTAALTGTVLFAQSTQANSETQKFPDGVTIKIPPNHKIVGDLHLLNVAPRERQTRMRMRLDLHHPRDVETIATPFQLVYNDLHIPPQTESRFRADCSIADSYEQTTQQSWDELELYYVLPHYHGLGNYFSLRKHGGPDDGDLIFELSGFNAEANGQSFDPPISLAGTDGFSFSCGFDNPRDEEVGWGIGDQEMCMMLGYTNGKGIFEGSVASGNEVVGTEDGIVQNTGPCDPLTVVRSRNQSMPTEEEIEAPLYVPESSDDEVDGQIIPECEDTPSDAEPLREPTLTNLEDQMFSVSCAFSACHDDKSAAAGLSLVGENVHDELMNHELKTPAGMPLVTPGDPERSWLYQVVSNCEPEVGSHVVSHMPRNSPTLLDPGVVSMVRAWIANGAPAD